MKRRKWITGSFEIIGELAVSGWPILAIYAILLTLSVALSFFCHWQVFCWVYNIVTAQLFLIVFGLSLLYYLEIPIGLGDIYNNNSNCAKATTGAKIWSVFVIALLVGGFILLNRHSKHFRFECRTYYVECIDEPCCVYHIFDDCEAIDKGASLIEMKGCEIEGLGLTLCDYCSETADEIEDMQHELYYRKP